MTLMKFSVRPYLRNICAVALLTLAAPLAVFAASISGTVTNKTINKPSAGDEVVLIAFGQGMQEAARTKTDAQGHYSIDVPDNGMHLIRVDHQKATYFEPVQPGTSTVNVSVYDVAAKVEGVRTEADVYRIETDPQGLRVIENFFVRNDSKPPRTQFSAHAYEIYLPQGAKVDGSAAMGPSGMPVSSTPVPVAGEQGLYSFIFPIRPSAQSSQAQGQEQAQDETRFQVSYHLPYSNSFSFAARVATPTDNLVVLMPKSMQFAAGSGGAFQPVNDDVNAQTFVAKNVTPAQKLEFTVSGTGSMPRESQGQPNAQTSAQPGAENGNPATTADNRPGGGLGVPIDSPDPLNKYKWWILSGLALVLVIAAAFLVRARPADAITAAVPPIPTAPGGNLLAALKEELFTLETDRLEGRLSDSEYSEAKLALEAVLRRALARQQA